MAQDQCLILYAILKPSALTASPLICSSSFSCRLQGLSFLLGYLAPICCILLINLITFLRLLAIVARPKPGHQVQDVDDYKRSAKVTFSITVVLGLTWLLAAFTLVPKASKVFVYLSTACNVLQGFFIFLLYIVLRPEVQRKWRKLILGKAGLPPYNSPTRASSSGRRFSNLPFLSSPSQKVTGNSSPPQPRSRGSSFDVAMVACGLRPCGQSTPKTDTRNDQASPSSQADGAQSRRPSATVIPNEFSLAIAQGRHSIRISHCKKPARKA